MKRKTDILLAGTGLVVLSPLLAIVAIGLKISSPGPVLFRQVRMGLNGKTFRIYKFRTMKVQKPNAGCQVTAYNDSRITTFGKFLRKYKIDELPQLINVIQGDMALVGPRPEVPEFAEIFSSEYERILQVRPGITHSATISFRREEEILALSPNPRDFYINTLMPEKLAAYEANLEQSLALDILTIVNTIIPQSTDRPLGPEHFALADTGTIIPFPETIVENIPAFPAVAAEAAGGSPAEVTRIVHP